MTRAESAGSEGGAAAETTTRQPPANNITPTGLIAGTELYQQPDLRVLLESKTDQPAGLYYRYPLDPATRYTLKIRGKQGSGRTTLRIKKNRDNTSRDYLNAPDGQIEKYLLEVSELELLFYSDEPFSYELEEITLLETPEVKVDRDLKELILAETPELAALLESDRLEAARVLLDWAANRVDQADLPSINRETTPRLKALSAARIYYEWFEPDRGGVFCGGMSVFYDKVLRLFGYRSFTINYGLLADDLTHVTVLVAQGRGEQLRFYLLDPTFNLTFRDEAGAILPLSEVLARDPGEIVVEEKSLDRRDFVTLKALVGGNISRSEEIELRQTAKAAFEAGGKVELGTYRRPGYSVADYYESFGDLLRTHGYSADLDGFIQLFRTRVFSTGPMPDPETAEAFHALLKREQIPFGKETQTEK